MTPKLQIPFITEYRNSYSIEFLYNDTQVTESQSDPLYRPHQLRHFI